MRISNAQALGWRLRRQSLDPESGGSATDVLRRVLAVRGWPAAGSDLAVYLRQAEPKRGDLERALESGEVIRSYAFRGGSYAFVPEVAAVVLACRTASRVWATRRYQQQGDFAVEDWEPLRDAVCEILADGPRTRSEIAAELERIPALRHLPAAAAHGAGADALYKPLHWWGDICFGPSRDGASTFRLLRGDQRWPGLPDVDDAGREAVRQYVGAYGPVTIQNIEYWLNDGLSVPRRRLHDWVRELGGELAEIEVGSAQRYVLTSDAEPVANAEQSEVVRFLPAYDPWLLGPGTADTTLLAAPRRALFSRGANPVSWRGVVSGSWKLANAAVEVSWFAEAGPPPTANLEEGLTRLSRYSDTDLSLSLSTI